MAANISEKKNPIKMTTPQEQMTNKKQFKRIKNQHLQ
ncbi:Uncharacterised protein [Serratia entomophila]|nr:Uncharacterised protein [Serratia entomophila]CAI1845562.1 Uncharacterised protein [Serratia entomophila]CAI1854141.1 Uncharacterised protein [Serratia entomophila]CAI1924052.1 Uncharacterised protein [Serratia entomophila]